MEATAVPAALAERLGPAATRGLVELLDGSEDSCVEHVMTQSAERFERRLVEEISKLRIEMVQGMTAIRQEMADQRFELLKWSFLFWIGQVVAVGTLLRLTGR